MRPSRERSAVIGIVLYPGVQMAAVHGLTDLFAVAGQFAADAAGRRHPALRITHWCPVADRGKDLACVHDSDPHGAPTPAILIVPPTLAALPDEPVCDRIAAWLHGRHAGGALLIAVCSGAFLVARTGLLDGRRVSTHRRCAQALAERFPRIAVDGDARILDHADILTAGGFMAWVDVGLILVERLLGQAARQETARFIGHDPRSRDTALHPAGFAPRQGHEDAAVLRAQDLIHLRDGQGISLAALAAAARLERRTLIRRFRSATGETPMAYCRAVRLARARELLEAGSGPVKEIAGSLGYADPSSFVRAFRRAHGGPPRDFLPPPRG